MSLQQNEIHSSLTVTCQNAFFFWSCPKLIFDFVLGHSAEEQGLNVIKNSKCMHVVSRGAGLNVLIYPKMDTCTLDVHMSSHMWSRGVQSTGLHGDICKDICKQPFIHHYIMKFRSWRPSWLQKRELDLIPVIGLKQLAQHLCNCMHLKVSSYSKLVFWDSIWLTVHWGGSLYFTLRNASGWAPIVIVVRGAGCYSKR